METNNINIVSCNRIIKNGVGVVVIKMKRLGSNNLGSANNLSSVILNKIKHLLNSILTTFIIDFIIGLVLNRNHIDGSSILPHKSNVLINIFSKIAIMLRQ